MRGELFRAPLIPSYPLIASSFAPRLRSSRFAHPLAQHLDAAHLRGIGATKAREIHRAVLRRRRSSLLPCIWNERGSVSTAGSSSSDCAPPLESNSIGRAAFRPRGPGRTLWSLEMSQPNLAERLGYGPKDRLLIVNCDDLGLSHSANVATFRSMVYGVATSATLIVPCPWAREAAPMFEGFATGVHLTLTCK